MGRAKGRRLLSERRVMPPKVKDTAEDTPTATDETKDVSFFNPHDGLKGRDGGPYLDYVEREQAEIVRANREDREPVFDGSTPATAGTPLVTAAELTDNSPVSNPSRANAPGIGHLLNDEEMHETDYFADPVSQLPVSTGDKAPEDRLDPTVDGGKSASPGAEVLRGEGPDESENPNPGSVGSQPGATVEKKD